MHQLLPRFFGRIVPDSIIAADATKWLRLELPLDPDTIEQLAQRSVRVYLRLCEHPDLVSLRDREFLFEVPFSFYDPASPPASGVAEIATGTIDCLARGRDNRTMVLEFKTGPPRPEHRRQLESYMVAARSMFPDAKVDGRIVYSPVGTDRTGSASKIGTSASARPRISEVGDEETCLHGGSGVDAVRVADLDGATVRLRGRGLPGDGCWTSRCFRSKPRAPTATPRVIGTRTSSVWANAVRSRRSSWTT